MRLPWWLSYQVKNLPAVQETRVQSLGQEDALEEEMDYPLQYSWASLVAQLAKNPPAMQETWVSSLGREDPLEEGMQPTLVFWPGESHGQRSLAGYIGSMGSQSWTLLKRLSTHAGGIKNTLASVFRERARQRLGRRKVAGSLRWPRERASWPPETSVLCLPPRSSRGWGSATPLTPALAEPSCSAPPRAAWAMGWRLCWMCSRRSTCPCGGTWVRGRGERACVEPDLSFPVGRGEASWSQSWGEGAAAGSRWGPGPQDSGSPSFCRGDPI